MDGRTRPRRPPSWPARRWRSTGSTSSSPARRTRPAGAEVAGAYGSRLPYLLKVLAIASPLSLQVHPDRARARPKGSPARSRCGATTATSTRSPSPRCSTRSIRSTPSAGSARPPRRSPARPRRRATRGRRRRPAGGAERGETASPGGCLPGPGDLAGRRPRPPSPRRSPARPGGGCGAPAGTAWARSPRTTVGALRWVSRLAEFSPEGPAGRRPAAARPRATASRRDAVRPRRRPARVPARHRRRDHGELRQRPARRSHPQARRRRGAAACRRRAQPPVIHAGGPTLGPHEVAWRPEVREFQLTRLSVTAAGAARPSTPPVDLCRRPGARPPGPAVTAGTVDRPLPPRRTHVLTPAPRRSPPPAPAR